MDRKAIDKLKGKVKVLFTFLPFYFLTFSLASCNLFIEEEDDGQEFKNVPVHIGEGYDAPVTTKENGCEVTYQYKKDVRVVSQEDQDRYITFVDQDVTTMFIEVHYAASTPEELLPVPGEILLSQSNERFPYGCCHRLQTRTLEDGVYKYLGTFASLKETFESLLIDGELTTREEVYEVMPEMDTDDMINQSRTRATSYTIDGMTVTMGDSIGFNIPLGFSGTVDLSDHGSITVAAEKSKNYYTVSNSFSFAGFSLDNMKFKLVQDVDEYESMSVTISGSGSKRILRFRPVRRYAINFSALVVVLFVNIDFNLTANASATFEFNRHKHIVYTYTIDLYNKTIEKDKEVITDTDSRVDTMIGGSFGVELQIQIGLGIYGKVLSVRIIPTFWAGVEATLPISKGLSWDIKEGAGLKFRVTFRIQVGVFLDATLSALFGDEFSKDIKKLKNSLDKLKEDAISKSAQYQALVNAQESDINNVLANAGTDQNKDKDEPMGAVFSTDTWDVIDPVELPWYPKIKDKSFKIVKSWERNFQDIEKSKLTFYAEFKIKDIGFFAALGTKYTPALRIMKGNDVVTTLFPDEGGMNAKVKKGQTYHFTLYDTNDDVTYTAIPCYFGYPVTRYEPDALDKGLPFCSTSPMITISDVELNGTDMKYKEGGGFGENNNYEYDYIFKISTFAALRGISNMTSWGLEERKTHKSYDSSKSTQDYDGTYKMNWTFHRYTHSEGNWSIKMVFYAYFGFKDSSSNKTQKYSSPDYEIEYAADGTFITPLARKRSAGVDNAVDGETEAILESIEGPDGTLVWQRDDGIMPL